MSIHVTGTVERKGFGSGTWALVSTDGETYELHEAPKELRHDGLKVKARGQVREDVMTMAMIGPVLEIEHYEILT